MHGAPSASTSRRPACRLLAAVLTQKRTGSHVSIGSAAAATTATTAASTVIGNPITRRGSGCVRGMRSSAQQTRIDGRNRTIVMFAGGSKVRRLTEGFTREVLAAHTLFRDWRQGQLLCQQQRKRNRTRCCDTVCAKSEYAKTAVPDSAISSFRFPPLSPACPGLRVGRHGPDAMKTLKVVIGTQK